MRNAHRHVIVPNQQSIFDRMIEDHRQMLEKKLEQVLNDHGIALDSPGVSLKVQQDGLKFIYTVERGDVVLSTFGFELDLFGVKDYSIVNDLDLSKILV
jgi:hypothetical protein